MLRKVTAVLSQYPDDCQPTSIQSLGNAGGFSGAQLWKLQTPRGELCLRRWPAEHPSIKRLSYIHTVASYAVLQGHPCIPAPISTKDEPSIAFCSDHRLWELTPWMPGKPLLAPNATSREQQPKLLRAALRSVAEFHKWTGDERVGLVQVGRPSSLKHRARFANELLNGELDLFRESLSNFSSPYCQDLETICHLASPHLEKTRSLVEDAKGRDFRMQPCLGDIWYEHVLFTDDEVTGIVDLGAMRRDTVASDLARLIGSVCHHIDDAWRIGLDAYSEIRTLTTEETAAISIFRDSAIVLSGFQWIRWLALERRTFENSDGVAGRLAAIIATLKNS